MRLARLMILACAIVAVPSAWAQAKYSYLHEATNAIFQIKSGSVQPTAADVVRIAAIGCNALDRLLKDDEFQTDLKRVAAGVGKHERYHATLRRDVRQFVDSFLQMEVKLLKDAGVSDEAAKDILSSASFLKDSIGKAPDPERLVADIRGLRNDLCTAAKTMHNESQDAQAQAQRQNVLTKLRLGP